VKRNSTVATSQALGETALGCISIKVEQVAYTDGVFTLTLDRGRYRALLVATGRKPNTKALNAGATQVELDDRGYIKIDAHFHTTCDGVYAIGDAAGQPAFTHVSWKTIAA